MVAVTTRTFCTHTALLLTDIVAQSSWKKPDIWLPLPSWGFAIHTALLLTDSVAQLQRCLAPSARCVHQCYAQPRNGQNPMYYNRELSGPLWLRAALQNSLTACMCHCNLTYAHLAFAQACTWQNPMCSSVESCLVPLWLRAALQNSLTPSLCHFNLTFAHLACFAKHHCSRMHAHTDRQAHFGLLCRASL